MQYLSSTRYISAKKLVDLVQERPTAHPVVLHCSIQPSTPLSPPQYVVQAGYLHSVGPHCTHLVIWASPALKATPGVPLKAKVPVTTPESRCSPHAAVRDAVRDALGMVMAKGYRPENCKSVANGLWMSLILLQWVGFHSPPTVIKGATQGRYTRAQGFALHG